MTSDASKNIQNFYCNCCDFRCSKKGDWGRHISTSKHIKATEATSGNAILHQMHECCGCGKRYNDRTGLWRHKKKCDFSELATSVQAPHTAFVTESSKNVTNDVVTILLNQNQEFKELIIEQNKHMLEQHKENQKLQQQLVEIAKEGKTINNTTTNNSFNMQFFLNEQCKDALNISDFINQLQLKIADLEMMGKVGYSEGISKIFIRGLRELDVFKRPIHCSDLKREVLYVKDKDSWEKDNEDKKKMKTAIKYVAAKNFKQINHWKEENPESNDTETKKHLDYHNIVINSMGGSTNEEDEKNYNKIIKNIAKEVIIEKDAKTE